MLVTGLQYFIYAEGLQQCPWDLEVVVSHYLCEEITKAGAFQWKFEYLRSSINVNMNSSTVVMFIIKLHSIFILHQYWILMSENLSWISLPLLLNRTVHLSITPILDFLVTLVLFNKLCPLVLGNAFCNILKCLTSWAPHINRNCVLVYFTSAFWFTRSTRT